jgi:hypothetical protein
MDDWRVADWRSPPAACGNPDDERRVAAADDDEERSIRRFRAATGPWSPGEYRVLLFGTLRVRPIWILAVAAVVFGLSMVWLQLAMMGTRSPFF